MLVYQKTIFDRYYCIKSFCHLKTLEKSSYLYYYNGAQVGFENACSRAKTYVILTFKTNECFMLLCAFIVIQNIIFEEFFFPKFSNDKMTLCNNNDQIWFSDTLT